MSNSNYISTESLYDSGAHLAHYGVKGMKWGVRRYQNLDGTLIKKKRLRKYGNLGNSKEFLKKHKKALIIGGSVALAGAAGIALARSKSGRKFLNTIRMSAYISSFPKNSYSKKIVSDIISDPKNNMSIRKLAKTSTRLASDINVYPFNHDRLFYNSKDALNRIVSAYHYG